MNEYSLFSVLILGIPKTAKDVITKEYANIKNNLDELEFEE